MYPEHLVKSFAAAFSPSVFNAGLGGNWLTAVWAELKLVFFNGSRIEEKSIFTASIKNTITIFFPITRFHISLPTVKMCQQFLHPVAIGVQRMAMGL